MPRYFSSGFSSGFQKAPVATATGPAIISAPPRKRTVRAVELAIAFVLDTRMRAAVVADDEAMVLALLGLAVGAGEAATELGLLFGDD